jgi:glycosyltransferase involved in cell wall biosynthesis
MRILMCVPYSLGEPTGNSVAARRLLAGFLARGAAVEALEPPAVQQADRVQSVARAFRPDGVLVLHAWRCSAAFWGIGEVSSAPRVVSMRGTDINEMLDDSATRDELTRILDAAAAIVVFHQAVADRLRVHRPAWAAKVCVIPNGVELPHSNVDYRARLHIPREAFVFGSVAGLREVKRPLLILPWLMRLREAHPSLTWLHAGPPLEEPVVAAFHEFARGRPWVHHVDHVPHDEIDSFLRAMDVFVASSRSEGMPHAAREAMLAERPCLLSDIEGHRAMASTDREALFFADEPGFMAGASRLISEGRLRAALGAAARVRIEREIRESDEIGAYLRLLAT